MPDRPTPQPLHLRHAGDELSLAIENDVHDVGRAREMVRSALPRWVDEGTRDDVLIVVSELVTNALMHGGPPRRLRLALGGRCLHIEVDDGSGDAGEPREVANAARGGFGLPIVRQLCEHWGTSPHDHGKRVWCDVRLPRAAPPV